MNEEDVFRKIVSGLKFDESSFLKDSQRFLTGPSKPFQISDIKPTLELDFFKTNASTNNEHVSNKKEFKKKKKSTFTSNQSLSKDFLKLETENIAQIRSSISSSVKVNSGTQQAVNKNVSKLKKQENPSDLRKLHKIYIEGSDIPELVTTFQQLQSTYNFNKICLKNVVENMGFQTLTPIQMQAIPALLHGREILACAPTGSGKTLAFLIPVVHHLLINKKKDGEEKKGFRGLILSPTKELAEQTFRECKLLVSQGMGENKLKFKKPLLQVKLLDKKEAKIYGNVGSTPSNKVDLLITTPNRLVYLLQHDPPLISLDLVEWLIVDESDKLFEQNQSDESFRDQLGCIYSACTNPKIRRAMFSATFAYDVQQWCVMNMDNVLQVTVGGKNTAVETIEQELKYVGNEQGKLLALKDIILFGFLPPVLVFVQSKERAKELFAELLYEGKKVDAIHSDRTPCQRENAIKCFRRGDTWILICTELLGRGMDFKGINLVINYDFPTSAISYIHRIGRTGRAGRKGRAITFFTDDDKPLLKSIANVIRQAGCEVPEYILKFKKTDKRELKRIGKREMKRRTIRTAPPDVLKKRRKLQAKKTTKSTKDETKKSKNVQRKKVPPGKYTKSTKDKTKKSKKLLQRKSLPKDTVKSSKAQKKKSEKLQRKKSKTPN